MKKVLLASSMLAALTGIAAAADLPSRLAPPVYAPPPIPTFTWTGAYFGVNAGYAFDHEGKFRTTDPVVLGLGTRGQTLSSDGFTGGGQIGYNYQLGGSFGSFGGPGSGIVFGIEADAAYTDLSRSRSVTYGADALALSGFTANYRSGLDYLGTVRGRLGYSFGQFLIYGTGGFAYGGVDNRLTVTAPGFAAAGSRSRMETGYAYGGGIEYALPTSSFLNFFKSSAVTLKAEYLHYDLGRSSIAVNNAAGNQFNTRVSNDGDLARIGLNYKFGSY